MSDPRWNGLQVMIEDFQSASAAINIVFATEYTSLDEELRDTLNGVISSPIAPAAVSEFGEVVYANADAFTEASRLVAADVLTFAASHGFYGLAEDQRGFKMAAILRGEEVENAPVPLVRFAPASVEEIVPPPVPPLP